MERDLAQVPALRALVAQDVAAYEAAVGRALPDDATSELRLARFVNSYDGDVAAAAEAFRAMLEWRRAESVETLRETLMASVDVIQQSSFPHAQAVREAGEYGPWYDAGLCYHGDVIHLEVVGRLDSSVLDKISAQRILEHHIGFFETRSRVLDHLSASQGRMVRTLQVRDLSKFGLHLLRQASALGVVQKIMKTGSTFYPESTRKSIFINTPVSFYGVWNAVSVVLRKKTQDKVVFLGSDYHRALLTYVGPRAIHRIEKMFQLEDHSFIDRGEAEDHLPLEYAKNIVVTAGRVEYYPLWLTRRGPRSSVEITLQPPLASADGKLAPMKLVFVTSTRAGAGAEAGEHATAATAVLHEVNLPPQAYATQDPNRWVVDFPQQLDSDVDSGFLLVTLDNTQSWVYSITVPLKARFVGGMGDAAQAAEAEAAQAEARPAGVRPGVLEARAPPVAPQRGIGADAPPLSGPSSPKAAAAQASKLV
jgi:hypothetical protein